MTDNAATGRCVSAAVARFKGEPGPLLEILHSVQNELGYVPADAVPLIAEALNLSRAEVHGVVSFYHHFRQRPAGRCVVQLCRAEACKSMNGDALASFATKHLGVDFGETRADGAVTLESVYCLGNCACAPSMTINGQLYGRATAHLLGELVERGGVK
ncbi:MAG TPA: formate dehydrogenase subunit gamma [Steroidobacteraceae bacterium]|jgi:formate dehydrogenase subunit gamma|nr:formate dehydrogenase subunit gamma [Steroidobacteraceae bacterium]